MCERSHDEGAEAGATDGQPRHYGPPFVKVLSDTVQPGQVDDAQAEADKPPGSDVEEEDGRSHGGQAEPGAGQDGADDRRQPPAQLVGHVTCHGACQSDNNLSIIIILL